MNGKYPGFRLLFIRYIIVKLYRKGQEKERGLTWYFHSEAHNFNDTVTIMPIDVLIFVQLSIHWNDLPACTRRNDNVIMTSKRRHDVVLT